MLIVILFRETSVTNVTHFIHTFKQISLQTA